jgi:hypothetical protein
MGGDCEEGVIRYIRKEETIEVFDIILSGEGEGVLLGTR